jgi:hypothetical protein
MRQELVSPYYPVAFRLTLVKAPHFIAFRIWIALPLGEHAH